MNERKIKARIDREINFDHMSAQRMAIAWIMAKLCPMEADEWLGKQRAELVGSSKLESMSAELEYLQEDLQLLVAQSRG